MGKDNGDISVKLDFRKKCHSLCEKTRLKKITLLQFIK